MNTCKHHRSTRFVMPDGACFALLACLASAACSKSEGTSTARAVPSEAPTIAITGTPPAPSAVASASASASAFASASASASASGTPKKPATTTTTTAPATAAGVASTPTPKADPAPLKAASTHLAGKNFTLDVASAGCRVDVPCAVTLRLAAVGEFHVNKEYPYKFTASAAPGVQFLASGDPNVFSRAGGDFREDGEKTATMTVRFKPTAAGEARVAGTYKLSVCSADQCQIEQQAVQLAVPVM